MLYLCNSHRVLPSLFFQGEIVQGVALCNPGVLPWFYGDGATYVLGEKHAVSVQQADLAGQGQAW